MMYFSLIIIWAIAACIGILILLIQVFNYEKIKSLLSNLKRKLKINSSQQKELMKEPFMKLLIYIIFLFIIVSISKIILPEDEPSNWINITLILLMVLSIIIIPIGLIHLLVYYFLQSIITIPNDIDKIKKEKAFSTGLYIFFKLLFIIIMPVLIFSFIYGIGQFMSDFPEEIGHLISLKEFIYALSVSFPISVEFTYDQDNSWWIYISFSQVILQKMVEIGVLGYIINIFSEAFKYKNN